MNTRTQRYVLIAAVLGSSMAFIDATAVNVALPSIQADFSATNIALQWTVEVYALVLSACIMIGGSLGDVFGRLRIFCIGVAGFAAASLACASATSIDMLNVFRALQGLAAALATPGSLALISVMFSPAERGKAIGTWSGFAAMTGAVGPLLGGWTAQHLSWRIIFLINVPFAIAAVWIALRNVTETRDESSGHSVDYFGALLAAISLGGFTYALIDAQNRVDSMRTLIMCTLSAIAFVGFLLWERSFAHPMMPLEHFRNRRFSMLNLYTFFLYAALGGSLFFVPFNLQNVQGYSATAAGAAMLPFILILFATSRWSGGLATRVGVRLPLIVGACFAAAGFCLYAAIGIGGSYWTTFFPAACVLGLGGMFFVAPLTTGVMSSLTDAHAGIASGINNAVSRIAGLLAIAALGLALGNTFYHDLDRAIDAVGISRTTRTALVRERSTLASGRIPAGVTEGDRALTTRVIRSAYVAGFRRIMYLSAVLSLLAACIAAFGLSRAR